MSFPFVKQLDGMQCGAACLRMICRFHGLEVPMAEMERLCRPTAEGVSLKAMGDAASVLGLETLSARITAEQLSEAPLPCILHWGQNHFVVLYGIGSGGQRFLIADPGRGRRKVSREELEGRWAHVRSGEGEAGIAMFLNPGPHFSGGKPKVGSRRSLGFAAGYLRGHRRHFLLICAALLVGCLLQLVAPFLTQWIVDIGIRHNDIGLVWLILLGELMIVAGRTAADFFRRWLLLHVSARMNVSMVSDFIIKLLRLPMSFFDTKLLGDLMQRMDDHGRVQSFLTGQLLGAAFTLLSLAVYGAVLLVYDRAVFAVFIAGSAVYGLWAAAFLGARKNIDYELFERQAVNQNRTYQLMTSMQEIKLQGCERRRRWEWEDAQADLFAVRMRSVRMEQAQEAGAVFINEARNILITVFAASAVIDGGMTLGAMLAVQYIVGQLSSPVAQLLQLVYSIQDVRISLERIGDIHSRKDEEPEGGGARGYASDRSISLRDVCFKYDAHAPSLTLDGVSFDIPEGKVTAIVGASGSGKTTLVKLMLGYYPVMSGSITAAGRYIGDYSMRWWRSRCGAVMQDGVIFSESISRNIAVDDGEVDSARMEAAAKVARIHDHVKTLPLGYDTRIGRDGMGLSQGQRQRVLIARAVYRDPDFIFLDEATNSLDAENERAIVESLAEFYKGRTVVVVAHRLSTVKNADQIIVLDGGRVAEIGDHDSLIASGGAYYNLVKNQLELGN